MEETKMVEEKVSVGQKVKGHFKKHKAKYITGGVVVAVGGVSFYIGRKYGIAGISMDVITEASPTNVAIGKDIKIENKTEITNNVTNTINMGGHVKKLVRRLSDGKLYNSVQEAADDAKVTQPTMSNHLNGREPHVKGESYEIAGIATN